MASQIQKENYLPESSSRVMAEANKVVQPAMKDAMILKQHGIYTKVHSISTCWNSEICMSMQGSCSSPWYCSTKLKEHISQGTVKSAKASCCTSKNCARGKGETMNKLLLFLLRNVERKVMLRENLNSTVQLYLMKIRDSGGAVSASLARIVTAAARGTVFPR